MDSFLGYRGRAETLDDLMVKQLYLNVLAGHMNMDSFLVQSRAETLDDLMVKQLYLNLLAGHMKWSHGFILGTE